MNAEVNSVMVNILDKDYQINCPPADEEALLKSARYLSEQMSKIRSRGNVFGLDKIAVMAALNITHDMLRKTKLISESRHITQRQIQGLEDKIEIALQSSRQIEI